MSLRLPIRLIRESGMALQTITENLSSGGFYCIVGEHLAPTERVVCEITIPAKTGNGGGCDLLLVCDSAVARVSAIAEGRYGLGCWIEEYSISSGV